MFPSPSLVVLCSARMLVSFRHAVLARCYRTPIPPSRVKTFVGASANALKIQVWTALIAMLLLSYPQPRARRGWSLSNLVALLRLQLFVHHNLLAWLGRTRNLHSWGLAQEVFLKRGPTDG